MVNIFAKANTVGAISYITLIKKKSTFVDFLFSNKIKNFVSFSLTNLNLSTIISWALRKKMNILEHVFLHSLIDSLKILVFVFVFNILLSFIETYFTNKLEKSHKINPFSGALFGLIPQCGVSVIGADLFIKRHITLGTIVAIFIACSDEALPIILSSQEKAFYVLPLLVAKMIIGFVVGFLIDLVYTKSKEKVHKHIEECEHEHEIKTGCCHHEINNLEEGKIHKHLIHPLLHSFKLFVYIFLINFIFGVIIHYVGEETIETILQNNKFFTPIYATIIGLIPNCASSVIITNLFINGNISFGSTLAGLITNAGLGMIVLFKNKNMIKKTIVIMGILVLTALVSGYVFNLIFGF